ncbi:tail fiber assembly protein [Pantoea wallisii]|nr:tail fiber assembly protein [Pantoea wallisii]
MMSVAKLNSELIAIQAGEVTIYNFDSETIEYLSSSIEYLAVGVGLPANACIDAPPVKKSGYAICRTPDLSAWEYITDHRDAYVYDIKTRERITISQLGEYPVETTPLAPETPWDVWDGGAWVKDVKAEKEALINQAEQQKISLMNQVNSDILPLQDAVDLGIASEDESKALQSLKKYRVLLNRVNPYLAPDIDWPKR